MPLDPLNRWKCSICNVVEHVNNKDAHVNGKRHRTRMKSTAATPWTCNVCELTMSMNNKDSHLAGFKHRSGVEAATRNAPTTDQPPTYDWSLWMCSVCGLTMAVTDKDSHINKHIAAAQATNSNRWMCGVCGLTVPVNKKDSHLHSHAASQRRWEKSARDIESSGDEHDVGGSGGGSGADRGGGGVQLETAFQDAADEVSVMAQRLLDVKTQLDAALHDRDITKNELAVARKAWDEKEHVLLLKTDELRAKIVSLDADLGATKAECTIERELRMSAEQERTSRMREAETVAGLNTKLEEALVDRQRLIEVIERKIESIRTGQSILSLARTKLSDVTSVRDTLRALVATLTATVDTLRKESATQVSQIQTLQQQLDLANKRWSSHGREIADEQLVWKDDEEAEAEKKQQEENIRHARERLEKMRREELKQKAEDEAARERKRAEESARQAEEEMKRREEEERRKKEAERQEQEKKKVYDRWRNASAQEMLRHQSISRTRFHANGAWTKAKALDRFLKLLGEFSALIFSAQQPLTFWSVPWPVLANPLDLAPGKIDWKATEAFFVDAKDILPAEEYGEMVLRAQRTFHPDRWVGKLALILDDGARASLKKVINTVAQVVNGLVTR